MKWVPGGDDLEGKNCATMHENKNDKMKLKGIECNNKVNKKAKKRYICKRPESPPPPLLFVDVKKTWADA